MAHFLWINGNIISKGRDLDIISSIFPENSLTLRLHEKFGFRTIGLREKSAKHDDK